MTENVLHKNQIHHREDKKRFGARDQTWKNLGHIQAPLHYGGNPRFPKLSKPCYLPL